MSALADAQRAVRDAVVEGDASSCAPLLVGGEAPLERLAVHQRHYEASLVRALLTKFPGCAWLAGGPFVTEGARRFVHVHPPQRPCIAEYGEGFPAFLARQSWPSTRPYIEAFGELEWRVGQVSIAVDEAPAAAATLERLGSALAEARLTLQPGLRYLHAGWPVDELLQFFLTEAAPERYALPTEDVWIEVRGARGTFRMQRLTPGAFVFRAAVADGQTLGDAAERAAEIDTGFEAGRGLGDLLAEGLVTGVIATEEAHR